MRDPEDDPSGRKMDAQTDPFTGYGQLFTSPQMQQIQQRDKKRATTNAVVALL